MTNPDPLPEPWSPSTTSETTAGSVRPAISAIEPLATGTRVWPEAGPDP